MTDCLAALVDRRHQQWLNSGEHITLIYRSESTNDLNTTRSFPSYRTNVRDELYFQVGWLGLGCLMDIVRMREGGEREGAANWYIQHLPQVLDIHYLQDQHLTRPPSIAPPLLLPPVFFVIFVNTTRGTPRRQTHSFVESERKFCVSA